MHCVVYTSCQREVECPGPLFSCRVGDALCDVYELSERSGVSRSILNLEGPLFIEPQHGMSLAQKDEVRKLQRFGLATCSEGDV
ncbi:hypothetical protein RRG08_044235 [Elysia crispata]|uniref:Uncharacterized protein n=1 Tax=Elysia crispata TaxID=231223 RepID=A0AAE1CP29_9GAST|nr:hypothetical protein RRG08_044235 [Elysia crispata]